VDGGAQSLHVHAFDAGREALAAPLALRFCAQSELSSMRRRFSLTTAAAIVGIEESVLVSWAWEESLTLLLRTRANRKGCIHDHHPVVRAIPIQVAASEEATVICAAAAGKGRWTVTRLSWRYYGAALAMAVGVRGAAR